MSKMPMWQVIEEVLHPDEVCQMIAIIMKEEGVNSQDALRFLGNGHYLMDRSNVNPNGELFEDAFIVLHHWNEDAYRASDYTLKLPKHHTKEDIIARWEELDDIFIDSYGRILQQFYGFPPGTERERIWKEFDELGLDVISALYDGEYIVKGGR